MATIPKASTLLVKICLFLITAINVAEASSRRSVLADLYKQAAEQNRPLILVVDNHSKNEGQSHPSHSNKHESDEIPVHYMYPRTTPAPVKSVNVHDKNSKQDLLKFYLSRLLLQNKDNRVGLKKKVGRSDDRDDVRYQDNRNYYRDERDRRDRRERYRERARNVDVSPHRYDRDRDNRYNRKPVDRYYRPKESREYKVRDKYYNAPEDRDRYDRDRYDRDRRDRYRSEKRGDRDREDRYRSEKHRNDRDRYDRYRSEKDRGDRGDVTHWKGRNKGRDYDKVNDYYRDDRDRYQSPSRYQSRNKNRYSDDYGANVLKNLLRISNDLNCDAKYECKGSCQRMARMLRQNGNGNCEDQCDEEYDCDESKEKAENKPEIKKDEGGGGDDCDARGSDESCGDEKGNGNVSTRGPPNEEGGGEDGDECGENGGDNRC